MCPFHTLSLLYAVKTCVRENKGMLCNLAIIYILFIYFSTLHYVHCFKSPLISQDGYGSHCHKTDCFNLTLYQYHIQGQGVNLYIQLLSLSYTQTLSQNETLFYFICRIISITWWGSGWLIHKAIHKCFIISGMTEHSCTLLHLCGIWCKVMYFYSPLCSYILELTTVTTVTTGK